ncbi:MAG: CAP domain-containing protein [Polyangiales bacterium]
MRRVLAFVICGILPSSAAAAPLAVDTSDRAAVRSFFLDHYASSVPSLWNGSVDAKQPGTTSPLFKAAVIDRVNWFRAMAGVPGDIVINEAASQKAQAAALMMSAQDDLSHDPPSTWADWTPEGAEGAHNSNLTLGVNGPEAITNYIRDDGENNGPTGHRRWILYPFSRAMGTGDVEAAGKHRAANALWPNVESEARKVRPIDSFVAWPPKGYVPYSVVFPRWSFSYPDADFSQTTVTVLRDGSPLQIGAVDRASKYGENTIVFSPKTNFDKPKSDVTFTIALHDVRIGGKPRDFAYTVTMFDPGKAPSAPPPVWSWPTLPTIQLPTVPTIPSLPWLE